MLIYRPEAYGKRYPVPFENKETHNTAMIDIAKGRNTGTCKFVCNFIPEVTLFSDGNVNDMPTVATSKKEDDMPF